MLSAADLVGEVFAVRGTTVDIIGENINKVNPGSELEIESAGGKVRATARVNFHSKLQASVKQGAEKIRKGDKVYRKGKDSKKIVANYEVPPGKGTIKINASRKATIFLLEMYTLKKTLKTLVDIDLSIEKAEKALARAMGADSSDKEALEFYILFSQLGQTGAETKLTLKNVGAGRYHIWLLSPDGKDYRNSYRAFEFDGESTKDLFFDFEDKIIEVTSDPAGARIYLNKKDTGLFTPAQMTVPWHRNEFEVSVEREDYVGARDDSLFPTQKLNIHERRHVHFDLRYREPIWVTVSGWPRGATVELNSRYYRGGEKVKMVKGESNAVRVSKEDYESDWYFHTPHQESDALSYSLKSKTTGNAIYIGYRGGTSVYPELQKSRLGLRGLAVSGFFGGYNFFADLGYSLIWRDSIGKSNALDTHLGLGMRLHWGIVIPYIVVGAKVYGIAGMRNGLAEDDPNAEDASSWKAYRGYGGAYAKLGFMLSFSRYYGLYLQVEGDGIRLSENSWYGGAYFGAGIAGVPVWARD